MSERRALITGYTGQDGAFLTDHLLKAGYEVGGVVRRVSTEPPARMRGHFDFSEQIKSGQLRLIPADLLAVSSLLKAVKNFRPDEVYNLAAQSHVGVSFDQPELTMRVNYEGLQNLFTALDEHAPDAHLYQASTSEMFGNDGTDQILDESSEFNPNSPYAISKTAAHFAVRARRTMGRYATAGILFNHESEVRGGDFVTQKIVRGATVWESDFQEPLSMPRVIELGNLNAQRDWGFAGDYVRAMHLINTQPEPNEYVIGTGEARSVREFAEAVFDELGHKLEWRGRGPQEEGWASGAMAIRVNPEFYRPNDVNYLRANPTLARTELGWRPQVTFRQLVERMVQAEIRRRHGDA